MSDRLGKADWIRHGLRTLAREGSGGLKVGPMAAALKVSRGSFYWHFRDIADFRTQLLRSWKEGGTDQVIRELASSTAEPERLERLMRRAFVEREGMDRAIRAWATQDEEAAAAVATVDAGRVAYIAGLLAARGVDPRAAHQRATFIYWAYLGRAIVMDPRHDSIPPAALADISRLFET